MNHRNINLLVECLIYRNSIIEQILFAKLLELHDGKTRQSNKLENLLTFLW